MLGTMTVHATKFLYTSGTFNWTGGMIEFKSNRTISVNSNGLAYGDVKINTNGNGINFVGATNIQGNLIVNTAANNGCTGSLDVYGNVTWAGAGFGGAVAITLRGNDSSWTRTAGVLPTGLITVAKTAGQKVTLGSNLTLNANQSISVTGGSIDLNNRTLTLSGTGNVTLAGGTFVKLSSGTLMIGGVSIPVGPYSGGNINL